MNQQLVCELNLALIPDPELASRHISFSKEMAGRYPPVIQLNGVTPRVAFTPHLTIYQVPVPVQDLVEMRDALHDVASKAPPFSLSATEFGSNEDEGSYEVRYEAPARLMGCRTTRSASSTRCGGASCWSGIRQAAC